MDCLIVILFLGFLLCKTLSFQSEYGSIFPIPLDLSNSDPHFAQCPESNGAYIFTNNCSLLHACQNSIHSIYSCIDGFYFNPTSRRCQYLPIGKESQCDMIVQIMQNSRVEFVRTPELYHHRKSATSQCNQPGIYPDILDCSLFHYCHQDSHREIMKCPKGLNFDPKTFLCSARHLVNCQYEPSIEFEDESTQYSRIFLDEIYRDYAPDTYLPMPNHFDEYIICGNKSESILMKCKSGLIYNALTTACENGPCTFDSTLCENGGHCIDDPTMDKGFRCLCVNQYEGEFCEKGTRNLDSTLLPLAKDTFDYTTHLPYTEPLNYLRENFPSQSTPLLDTNIDDQRSFEQILRMGLTFFASLFGIILFGAIILGLIRLIDCSFMQTVGQWNTLREESCV